MILTLGAGCASIPKDEAKANAQRQWNEARAAVKHRLAGQQLASGLPDESIRTSMETLALDPTLTEAYVVLARAHLESGKTGAALQVIESARGAGICSNDLLYTEGVILEQRELIEAAAGKYAELLEADPFHADGLVAYAECLVSLDKAEEALARLRQYLENVNSAGRYDDDGSVAFLAARVAQWLGHDAEADARFTQGLAAAPRHRPMHEEFGLHLVRTRRYEKAVAILKPLVENASQDPPSAGASRGLAASYMELNDPRSARSVLQAHLERHPNDPAAQMMLAKAALAQGDLPTASRALRAAQSLVPTHPEVRLVRAVINRHEGDLPAARAGLEKIIAANPSDVEAHCLLGETFLDLGQKLEASEHFQEALKSKPDCQWAHSRLVELSVAGVAAPRLED
jgi:tetratricopeptide (TPR) repeat protein